MADFKVVEGADKVGAWAIKYNELVDEVIESVNTVDDGVKVTITYNKIGGGTFTSVIDKNNVVTGKTYDELLTLALLGELVVGKIYELSHNTIDSISNTDIVYTGVTETLLLTPANGYNFHTQVISKSYPQDIIYYDFSNNGFDLPNGNRVYRKNGYIFYRHDTVRNLKVRGYDFRNHILFRYPVNKTGYNQYNAGSTYDAGDYVWYSNKLYVYTKSVGAGTIPSDSNSILLIENNFYLTTTGVTNYGTTVKTDILLYPSTGGTVNVYSGYTSTGVVSGYTFGTSFSENNSSTNYKNIELDSYYTYNGWKPTYDYTSTNYTHKPNIVVWDSSCQNGYFSDSVSDVTVVTSTLNNFKFDNINSVNFYGNFTKFNCSYLSNSQIVGAVNNVDLTYSNDLYFVSGLIKSKLTQSEFSFIGAGNTNSSFEGIKYSTILNGCSENIINKFYYSKLFNAASNNTLVNVVNSVIGGTYHDVVNSTYINIGTTGNTSTYGTNTNNQISNSNFVNLYGSNNVIEASSNLGVVNTTGSTPYLFADRSTFKPGCSNISTYIATGQITNCYFGENSNNIRLLSWNVGLTNCVFAPSTSNINFSTSDFTSRAYSNIKTSLSYNGYKASPARANITITNIGINDKNFIGLSETNQLVGVNFTGTTPTYTSIESYQ